MGEKGVLPKTPSVLSLNASALQSLLRGNARVTTHSKGLQSRNHEAQDEYTQIVNTIIQEELGIDEGCLLKQKQMRKRRVARAQRKKSARYEAMAHSVALNRHREETSSIRLVSEARLGIPQDILAFIEVRYREVQSAVTHLEFELANKLQNSRVVRTQAACEALYSTRVGFTATDVLSIMRRATASDPKTDPELRGEDVLVHVVIAGARTKYRLALLEHMLMRRRAGSTFTAEGLGSSADTLSAVDAPFVPRGTSSAEPSVERTALTSDTSTSAVDALRRWSSVDTIGAGPLKHIPEHLLGAPLALRTKSEPQKLRRRKRRFTFDEQHLAHRLPPVRDLKRSRKNYLSRRQRKALDKLSLRNRSRRSAPLCEHSDNSMMAELRNELTHAEHQLASTQMKVRASIEWVQVNCPKPAWGSIPDRAVHLCRGWGAEKIVLIMRKYECRIVARRYMHWRLTYDRMKTHEIALLYVSAKACESLFRGVWMWADRRCSTLIRTWKSEARRQRHVEVVCGVLEIQRTVRGFLCVRAVLRMREAKAALTMQRVARGRLARVRARGIRERRARNAAAAILQRKYKGFITIRHAKAVVHEKRRQHAAISIQRAARGYTARTVLSRELAKQHREREAVITIQRMARGMRSRKWAKRMRIERDEEIKHRMEAAATHIQSAGRGLLARKQRQSIEAERAHEAANKRKQEDNAATMLQFLWRRKAIAVHAKQLREAKEAVSAAALLESQTAHRTNNCEEQQAVTKLQAWSRGRQARNSAKQLREVRRARRFTLLKRKESINSGREQAQTPQHSNPSDRPMSPADGPMSRAEAESAARAAMRNEEAAVALQSIARGFLGRRIARARVQPLPSPEVTSAANIEDTRSIAGFEHTTGESTLSSTANKQPSSSSEVQAATVLQRTTRGFFSRKLFNQQHAVRPQAQPVSSQAKHAEQSPVQRNATSPPTENKDSLQETSREPHTPLRGHTTPDDHAEAVQQATVQLQRSARGFLTRRGLAQTSTSLRRQKRCVPEKQSTKPREAVPEPALEPNATAGAAPVRTDKQPEEIPCAAPAHRRTTWRRKSKGETTAVETRAATQLQKSVRGFLVRKIALEQRSANAADKLITTAVANNTNQVSESEMEERAMRVLVHCVVTVQRHARGFVARQRVLRLTRQIDAKRRPHSSPAHSTSTRSPSTGRPRSSYAAIESPIQQAPFKGSDGGSKRTPPAPAHIPLSMPTVPIAQLDTVLPALGDAARVQSQTSMSDTFGARLQQLEELEQTLRQHQNTASKTACEAEMRARKAEEALHELLQQQRRAEDERQREREEHAKELNDVRVLALQAQQEAFSARSSLRSAGTNRGSAHARLDVAEQHQLAQPVQAVVSAPASSVQRSNVEDEWVELWDASTQAHYYYNVATQESSWTKPAVAAGHESEGYDTAGTLTDYDTDKYEYGAYSESEGDQWIEYWDDSAQAKYWYNPCTGEASWTKPGPASGSNSVESTPEDWVSYIDEETGQEYWYNVRTGETKWA